MINLLIVVILLAIVGGASLYIYKQKQSGAKCIGCPHAKTCGGQCGNCGGCGHM